MSVKNIRRIGIFFSTVGLISLFVSCRPAFKTVELSDQTYRLNASIQESDPVADSIIAPYKASLDDKMNAVIGRAAIDLQKEKPESTMGNWVADALRDYALENGYQVDFALQNYGGMRIGELPRGPLKVGQLYELMPFENLLVILEADSRDLRDFFERISRYGGWPVSSEVNLVIQNDQAAVVELSGEPLREDRLYRIAMPDYIANGGDRCDFFRDNARTNTGVLIRDVLIHQIRQAEQNGKAIRAEKEGRIINRP